MIEVNILVQVDGEGHRKMLLYEIFGCSNLDDDITDAYGFNTTQYGTKEWIRTTKGWDICVDWKYGSQAWIAMKYLNNSYPS